MSLQHAAYPRVPELASTCTSSTAVCSSVAGGVIADGQEPGPGRAGKGPASVGPERICRDQGEQQVLHRLGAAGGIGLPAGAVQGGPDVDGAGRILAVTLDAIEEDEDVRQGRRPGGRGTFGDHATGPRIPAQAISSTIAHRPAWLGSISAIST